MKGILAGLCVTVLVPVLAGCSTPRTRSDVLDREGTFGYSVRHMGRVQAYSGGIVTAPTDPVPVDGDKVSRALRTYRADTGAVGVNFEAGNSGQ